MRIPILWSALLFAAFLAFLAPTPGVAQANPQALGRAFLEAVDQGNREALERLVHPSSSDEVPPARISQVVDSWLGFDVQPSWEIRVDSPDAAGGFDAVQRTIRVGPLSVEFPADPAAFLVIVEHRTVAASGGLPPGTLSIERARDAIAPIDGEWRILIGTVRNR